jgi:hypothetical protein
VRGPKFKLQYCQLPSKQNHKKQAKKKLKKEVSDYVSPTLKK